MNDLPWLPFIKVLSYLDLQDRLKLRTVSRSWRNCIGDLKEKNLFYSEKKRGQLYQKNRWVIDRFDRNFVTSFKFESFFNFTASIFSHLKHLRIYSLTLQNGSSLFKTLNSFHHLEELDLIDLKLASVADFQLALPNLTSFKVRNWNLGSKLNLAVPKLQKITIWHCYFLELEVIHPESVESIIAGFSSSTWGATNYLDFEIFKMLKYLWCNHCHISETFLTNLGLLKEAHLNFGQSLELFAQKQRQLRDDLKIYHHGLLLKNSLDLDKFPRVRPFDYNYSASKVLIKHYVENQSRLADELLDVRCFFYSEIEKAVSRVPMDFWQKFSELDEINVQDRPKNVQQFLQFLTNLGNITALRFNKTQPQNLFDQLPDHCPNVQKLFISSEVSDLRFLFRFGHLTELSIKNQVDADFVSKVFKEFDFILSFEFKNHHNFIFKVTKISKRFHVNWQEFGFSDLNKAISAMNLRQTPKASKPSRNRRKF